MNHVLCSSPCLLPFLLATMASAQTTVLTTDFTGSLPAAITAGSAQLESVQGFAGLGPIGNSFGGTFLRSETGNVVTIQLSGLPPHNAIQLDFLFAAIDSLDGTGSFPAGDFLAIRIDGNTWFRESFANASAGQIQSYVPPPGVELARRIDLGFSGPGSYYTDSAYWLGGDPAFQAIGHTSANLTITMQIEGAGIQSLGDESWGIDNLTIRTLQITNPGSVLAYGTSCGPTLSGFGSPVIGGTLPVFLQGLPASTVLPALAIGLSDASFGGGPLPLPLDALGATGCVLLHDLAIDITSPMLLQGNAATTAFVFPSNPAFIGFTFFLQGWALAPGVNPFGFTFSNGLRVQLGS